MEAALLLQLVGLGAAQGDSWIGFILAWRHLSWGSQQQFLTRWIRRRVPTGKIKFIFPPYSLNQKGLVWVLVRTKSELQQYLSLFNVKS